MRRTTGNKRSFVAKIPRNQPRPLRGIHYPVNRGILLAIKIMNKKQLALFSGLMLWSALVSASPHWSYGGDDGPANWGRLSPDFSMCERGSNQSPINIEGALKAGLAPLQVDYAAHGADIVNNGHTIQIGFEPGNSLMLDGTSFELRQVHFHAPSENQIEGVSFPFEAHLVHADKNGKLAVIAIMFNMGNANQGLGAIWPELPTAQGSAVKLTARIKPADLMPANLGYYRFSGSLTTPPCSEGVRWLVLKTPVSASRAQIEAFEKIMNQPTNRPIQALNARLVVQ